ncbi:unnamed protein product [Cylicocyclus nassatus]|uniref:FBA domain-containing protein n=1 Tax=Cylicocyclus nassatus TaxID=53992 RepID=A0AA36DNW6_CYLNA|nr:unnamed protein product [Cylicocyclus nassatus]
MILLFIASLAHQAYPLFMIIVLSSYLMASLVKVIGDIFNKGGRNQQRPGSPFRADEIMWFEVLKRCDNASLLRAELACRLFRRILTTPQFWIEKCEYDGVTLPSFSWRKYFRQEADNTDDAGDPPEHHEFDYKRICFRRPFERNLAIALTASCTLNSLKKKGMVFRSGGDGIRIENPPEYCEQNEVPVCFATSYQWCSRYFEIDLSRAGVQDWVMDLIRPEITVRERCACREDCGAEYELRVHLMKDDEVFDENVILPRFRVAERSWGQWEGGKCWETVEHVLKEYPAGMRKLGVFSRGKDTQFWAGHYGSKC